MLFVLDKDEQQDNTLIKETKKQKKLTTSHVEGIVSKTNTGVTVMLKEVNDFSWTQKGIFISLL